MTELFALEHVPVRVVAPLPGPDYPVHKPHARRGPRGKQPYRARLPRGAWARAWLACRDCGTTERPHAGLGYCRVCYLRNRATVEERA